MGGHPPVSNLPPVEGQGPADDAAEVEFPPVSPNTAFITRLLGPVGEAEGVPGPGLDLEPLHVGGEGLETAKAWSYLDPKVRHVTLLGRTPTTP